MENRESLTGRISEKIIGNTIFNYLGNIWQILISFFLTPYILRQLGMERFGIWAVTFAITSYFSLLDLGVGGSFTKFIAEYDAKKDVRRINNVISHGFLFYLPLGALQFAIGFLIIEHITDFINISAELRTEAKDVFLLGLIAFTIQNIGIPLRSLFEGFQKMGLLNWIRALSTIPRIAGTVFFLQMGYGIIGLAINEIILAVIINFISLFYSYRIFPQMKMVPRELDREILKNVFTFGYKLQVSKIAYLINFQTDKFIIGYFLNTVMVGFYDIGARVASLVRSFPVLMVSAITPAASELDSKGSSEMVWKLYIKSSRYLLLFTTPLFVFTLFNSSIILEVWLGAVYAPAVLVLQILCVAYFFNLISGAANVIAIGIGKPEFEMETSIYASIINIGLSILLIMKYGLTGCVGATAVSFVFYSFYLIYKFHSYYGKSLSIFLRLMALPLLSSLVSASLALGFQQLFISQSYLMKVMVFGGESLIFVIVYGALIYLLKLVGSEEMEIARNMIKRFNYGKDI
ncbi:MAG: flippase [Candidatus Schekmanbacteria bacterium]|nr:flippase [Candidatus Schekmanbacteria bacterium]